MAASTVDDLKANNDCVNVHAVIEAAGPRVAASAATFATRTLWHGRYDQHAGTADFRFYLGDGAVAERRSDYLRFGLDAARVPVTNA